MMNEDRPVRDAAARIAATYAEIWRRTRDGGASRDEPAFCGRLGLILIAGLAAMVVAHWFDAAAVLYVRSSRSAAIAWMADVTNIGKAQWYLVPPGLLFLLLAAEDWRALKPPHISRVVLFLNQTGFAFAAIAGAGVVADIIKIIVGRARPQLFDTAGPLGFSPFTLGYAHASFPSGHSTTMGAVAAVLMLWFPRWRAPIAALCFLAAATRVAALAHYPSDVIAGFTLGFVFSVFLARWLARRGVGFRLRKGRLLPEPRLKLAMRRKRATKRPAGRGLAAPRAE